MLATTISTSSSSHLPPSADAAAAGDGVLRDALVAETKIARWANKVVADIDEELEAHANKMNKNRGCVFVCVYCPAH